MPVRRRGLWALGLISAMAALGTILLAEQTGRAARRSGLRLALAGQRQPPLVAADAREVHALLLETQTRARIVVSLSSFLHFVDTEPQAPALRTFPYGRPGAVAESVDDRNLLWVLSRTNVARHVISVLPREVYEGKLAGSGAASGLEALELFDFGLRRSLTRDLPILNESVVVVVDASLFLSSDAGRLLEALRRPGFRADLVLFNEAGDNPSVTPAARARLRELAAVFEDGRL